MVYRAESVVCIYVNLKKHYVSMHCKRVLAVLWTWLLISTEKTPKYSAILSLAPGQCIRERTVQSWSSQLDWSGYGVCAVAPDNSRLHVNPNSIFHICLRTCWNMPLRKRFFRSLGEARGKHELAPKQRETEKKKTAEWNVLKQWVKHITTKHNITTININNVTIKSVSYPATSFKVLQPT